MKHLLIAFSLVISTAGSALAYCPPPIVCMDGTRCGLDAYNLCIQREIEKQKREIQNQQREIDKLRHRRLYNY